MIIEFVGIPCSGKTTLAAYTANIIDKPRHDAWTADGYWARGRNLLRESRRGRPDERIGRKILFYIFIMTKTPLLLGFCIKKILFTSGVIKSIINLNGRIPYKINLIKFFLIHLFQYGALTKPSFNRDMPAILDEGLLQFMFTLFIHEGNLAGIERLKWYVRHVPLPDYLIFLDCDPGVCFQRMMKRGRPFRLREASPGIIRSSLVKGRDLFISAGEIIGKSHPAFKKNIFRINGDNLDNASEDLRGILSGIRGINPEMTIMTRSNDYPDPCGS